MSPRNKYFLKSFFWPAQIVFGNGKNLRSITHIDDVFNAFTKSTKSLKTIGKTYWISSLEKTQTVDEIYYLISKSLKRKVFLIHIPNFICELISVADSIYTFITGKINPTLHASGKFHKNIANSKINQNYAALDFKWQTCITRKELQREIHDEIYH